MYRGETASQYRTVKIEIMQVLLTVFLLWFCFHIINGLKGESQATVVSYGTLLTTLVGALSGNLVVWNRLHVQNENNKIAKKLDQLIAICEHIPLADLHKSQ